MKWIRTTDRGIVRIHPFLLWDIKKNEMIYLNTQPQYLCSADTQQNVSKNFKKLFLEGGEKRTRAAFSILKWLKK